MTDLIALNPQIEMLGVGKQTAAVEAYLSNEQELLSMVNKLLSVVQDRETQRLPPLDVYVEGVTEKYIGDVRVRRAFDIRVGRWLLRAEIAVMPLRAKFS